MKNVLILGAGTGGALVANLLRRKLDVREWTITVVDPASQHIYQPGLLFLPFRMDGYERAEDVVRPIASPLPAGVQLVAAQVREIDHAKRVVRTDAGSHAYDFLVSAMG